MMKQRYLQWIHRATHQSLDHQDFRMFLDKVNKFVYHGGVSNWGDYPRDKSPCKRTSLLAALSLVMTNSWAVTDEELQMRHKGAVWVGDQGYLEQRQKDTWIGKEGFY